MPGISIGERPASQRREWYRFRRKVLPLLFETQGGLCAICGGPIDIDGDGRRGDGPSLDHVTPLHSGAPLIPTDVTEVRLVHARCNQVRGSKTRQGQGRKRARVVDAIRPPEPTNINGHSRIDRGEAASAQDFLKSSPRLPVDSAELPRKAGDSFGNLWGFQAPRLATPIPANVSGSYGAIAAAWAREHLEIELLPWQAWALDRILEHREDGSLRWRIVVLTVSRQSGKSVLGRVGCGWRTAAAHELFGERQLVLSTANKQSTAREIWQAAAYDMVAHNPGVRLRLAMGSEEIRLIDTGGRWLVQAATANLAVGLSVSMALVDEAWNVDRQAVEAGLVPTMLQRKSPQLWIVSTAGDRGSDLLETYRGAALNQIEDPETAEILLLEWSADPSAALEDREGWRAASPQWSEAREAYIATQLAILPEHTFRTQMLNQKVDALGGWMTRAAWEGCRSPLELAGGAGAERLYAAIEYSQDGETFGMVAAQRQEDRIVIRSFQWSTIDDLWAHVCNLPRSALLLQSVGFRDKLPLAPCESRAVGVNELRIATRYAARAISDGVIAHNGDPDLTAHVLAAVISYSENGPVLSMTKSPAPITLARAMTWAIGAILEPQAPKPMIASRDG